MSINILHLSDIHIGKPTSDWPTEMLQQKIVTSLSENLHNEIDFIITTGDIFDQCPDMDDDTKISNANSFFNNLWYGINRMQPHHQLSKEDFLFVPGNHDINRKQQNPWHVYDQFMQTFYDSIPAYYLSDHHAIFKADIQKKLLLIGLNSNFYAATQENSTEMIDDNQLRAITEHINADEKFSDCYTVAFLHHPFYLFTESSHNQENGTLRGSDRFLKFLAKWNVNLVLHGHKHDFRNTIMLQRGMRKLNVFAAGSITETSPGPSFNLVEIGDINVETTQTELSLWKATINSGNFTIGAEKLDDPLKGMLCESLSHNGRLPADMNSSYGRILNMMNELYIFYDAITCLEREYYLDFLLFSVEKRVQYHEKGFEQIDAELLKQEFADRQPDCIIPTAIFSFLITETNNINIAKELKYILASNLVQKRYCAYVLLAIYCTDIYFDFAVTNDAELIENGIKYDYIINHVFLSIKCNHADYYTSITGLIQKYRVFLDKTTDYFSSIKLKIKGLIPEIKSKNTDISFQDFNAAIPRLIPLLTGTNIYASDTVFARELVQNAIDAVSFREKIASARNEVDRPERPICIEIGDNDGDGFFKITDQGIGMGQEIIEQYFTTLGKSYYNEFQHRQADSPNYNAISNFGIGFLSVFKPCNRIVIETKHYEENLYHKLEIKDGQDFFIIHSEENPDFPTGTTITCHFKEENRELKDKLIHYLNNIMLDIKYPLYINNNTLIRSREIRNRWLQEGENIIFIPFDEESGKILRIINYQHAIGKDCITKYRHGMIIRPKQGITRTQNSISILNAGILMENTKLEDIFCLEDEIDLQYAEAVINFPPNWLDIDVSREKASKITIKDLNTFKEELFSGFQCQWTKYLNTWENTKLASIFEIEEFMEKLCSRTLEHSLGQVLLQVQFDENSMITFAPKQNQEARENSQKVRVEHVYNTDNAKSAHTYFIQSPRENFSFEEFSNIITMSTTGYHTNEPRHIEQLLQKLGVYRYSRTNDFPFPIVLSACLKNKNDDTDQFDNIIRALVEKSVLEEYSIRDLKNEESSFILYKVLVRFEMVSDELTEIIQRVAENYKYITSADPKSDSYKYDFIWEKIIYAQYKNYYHDIGTNSCRWENIRTAGQRNYLSFRNTLKEFYGNGPNSRLDAYMIASCYMSGLLQIQNEALESTTDILKPDDEKNKMQNIKYKWILDSGIAIVYMWKLSEAKKQNNTMFQTLLGQKNLKLPDQVFYDNFAKLLSLKEASQGRFHILCFSELLHWIALYNEKLYESNYHML